MRVLIVEDEPDGAELLRRMLRGAGIEIDVAVSGEDALHKLAANADYAAAVIDLALPAMDGMELMETLRGQATTQGMVLVAITAYHTPELKARALDAGFDAFFPKPLDVAGFPEAVLGLIAT